MAVVSFPTSRLKAVSAWPLRAVCVVVLALVAALLTPGSAPAEGISGESEVHTNTTTEGDGTRTPDIIEAFIRGDGRRVEHRSLRGGCPV